MIDRPPLREGRRVKMLNVKRNLSKVKPYVPGRPIEEVKRELGLTNVIKLASNENPYGPSPKVIAAMQKTILNVNRYPDGGCFYLRQALARHLAVKPEQLIFTNGSDELIVIAVRAFVEEGDEVIMSVPTFLIYNIASTVAGAKVKQIPLKDFRYDLAAMKAAVTRRTKMIFLGNPDNPAGSYFTTKELEEFLRGVSKNIAVFIDEAYFEYVDAKDYVDSIALIKKHPNIIVARTFSKMYGLAGLRIGYGIAGSEMIGVLEKLREPFNVNSVAQAAAIACLGDRKYYTDIAGKFREQRTFLRQALQTLGFTTVPSATNFILIKTQNAGQVADALMKKGVIVRNMQSWGLDDYIRVTIGTDVENKRFLRTWGRIVKRGEQ